MTRIAIPVVSDMGLASQVNEHFGMSEYFAVLDVKAGSIASCKIIRSSKGDEKKIADMLIGKGVGVVLAGRIGSCHNKKLLDGGVRLFTNAEGTVEDAVRAYRDGRLQEVLTAGYTL